MENYLEGLGGTNYTVKRYFKYYKIDFEVPKRTRYNEDRDEEQNYLKKYKINKQMWIDPTPG